MLRSCERYKPRAAIMVLVGLIASGCNGDDTLDKRSSGTSRSIPITGGERLTWDQSASSLAEVNSYRFSVFVDNALAGGLAASCGAVADSKAYSCSAALPPLSPGAHTLAIQTTDSAGIASPLSSGLSVLVATRKPRG